MTQDEIIEALESIINYPPEGHPRRTEDGYPAEIIYDKFAYYRIVDSYRDVLKNLIKDIKEIYVGR